MHCQFAFNNFKPMKNKWICIALFLLGLNQATKAQEIYSYVEQMPKPSFNISDYLHTTLTYPLLAKEQNAEGKVVLKFIVDSIGAIKDIKIVRSVHPALDTESVRVVSMMPKWEPGKQNGKPVNVYYSLPIIFELPKSPIENVKADTFRIMAPKPTFDLQNFFYQNVRYPQKVKDKKLDVFVKAQFTIDTLGKVSNIHFTDSSEVVFQHEIRKVISSMPTWESGTLNGKPVCITLALNFFFDAVSVEHHVAIGRKTTISTYLKLYGPYFVREENCK